MKKTVLLPSLVVLSAMALVFLLATSVSAANTGASYGSSSEGAGPCLENRWGQTALAGNGYGSSSEGAGPCLENRWGQTAI